MKSIVDLLVKGKVTLDVLQFNKAVEVPPYTEGIVFYNESKKTPSFFTDIPGVTGDIMQEQWIRVFNNTASTILNGYVVSVTGSQSNGVVQVGLAIASDKASALNTVGIATHDIPAGTYGWATTSGTVGGINTSLLTEGVAIYLSETVPGWYQETRPASPSYEVRMGGVAKSDITVGSIYAELRIISNDHDNNAFFNGAILEPNQVNIVANGTTVNCALVSLAPNSKLSLVFNQQYVSVTSGININLTLGTDAVPVENWVYINSSGTILISTSGWPTGIQYTPVARVVVQSAASAQLYGVRKSHAYTDHLAGGVGQGHLSDLNNWIRKRPAAWLSGGALTLSSAANVATARLDLSYTSSNVAQLHDHIFPAFNTATRTAFVINDFATPYEVANGITPAIDQDSLGGAIGNNKYYNIVIWGVVSEETKDCQLFFNLPKGSYSNVTDALNDVDNYTDYTIPSAYLGTGFLKTKLTLQRNTTTVVLQAGGITDLRGSIPAVGGGSVIGGGGISTYDELTDTPTTKVGQALKLLRVNAAETSHEYVALADILSTSGIAYTNVANQVFTESNLFGGLTNTAGLADHTRVDGYGIMMNRATSFITNAAGGSLVFGLGATHGANTKLTISETTSVFANALSASNLSGTNTGNNATNTQYSGLITAKAANTIYAGPESGGSAVPAFRSLVTADIPALPYLADSTQLALTKAIVTNQYLTSYNASTGVFAAKQIDYSEISGTPTIPTIDPNTTIQGNTFNGTLQLVKTDATGKLPAIDGSQLTNLPAPTALSGTSAQRIAATSTPVGVSFWDTDLKIPCYLESTIWYNAAGGIIS